MLCPYPDAFGQDVKVLVLALLLHGSELREERLHALVFMTGRSTFINDRGKPFSITLNEGCLDTLHNEGLIRRNNDSFILTPVGGSFANSYGKHLPGLNEWAVRLLSAENANRPIVEHVCAKARWGDVVVFPQPIQPIVR